jgi:hypothetical protein
MAWIFNGYLFLANELAHHLVYLASEHVGTGENKYTPCVMRNYIGKNMGFPYMEVPQNGWFIFKKY